MKKYALATILLIAVSLTTFSQNYIYIGDNRYEATSTWTFRSQAVNIGHSKLTVAKNNNGGYLLISIFAPNSNVFVNGDIHIFLNDGSKMRCKEIGIRDLVNNWSITLYDLNKDQIEILKKNRITKIRFTYRRNSYTAINNRNLDLFNTSIDPNDYYKTDVEISKLFN